MLRSHHEMEVSITANQQRLAALKFDIEHNNETMRDLKSAAQLYTKDVEKKTNELLAVIVDLSSLEDSLRVSRRQWLTGERNMLTLLDESRNCIWGRRTWISKTMRSLRKRLKSQRTEAAELEKIQPEPLSIDKLEEIFSQHCNYITGSVQLLIDQAGNKLLSYGVYNLRYVLPTDVYPLYDAPEFLEVELPPLRVTTSLSGDGMDVRVIPYKNTDRYELFANSPHPHVLSGNSPCLNTYSELLHDAWKAGDYFMLMAFTCQFLSSVDVYDSAGKYALRHFFHLHVENVTESGYQVSPLRWEAPKVRDENGDCVDVSYDDLILRTPNYFEEEAACQTATAAA